MRFQLHCSSLNALVAPHLVLNSSVGENCQALKYISFPGDSAVRSPVLRSGAANHEEQRLPFHVLFAFRRRCGGSIPDRMP